MKTLKTLVLLLLVVSMSSCNFDINFGQVDGNGEVTTENRIDNESFDEVKTSSGIDVYLTEGTTTKVVVEADSNLQDIITTYIEDGRLVIGTKEGENIGKAKAKKVYVTYIALDKIQASSGSDVTVNDILKSENLELDASSGADIEVEIFSKMVYAEASSGADITVSGKASNLNADASSGADIDAKDLLVVTCTAEASSGAGVTVNVKDSLEASASSGGDINYYGNPAAVNNKSSRSGDVEKM